MPKTDLEKTFYKILIELSPTPAIKLFHQPTRERKKTEG